METGHSSWHIGVLLALGSSFVGALGDNFVRLSYMKEAKRTNKLNRPLYRRPLWILGEILTIIINPAMTIFALKYAAASIVVPFGGLHIFWNAILCGYLLKENLSRYEVIGSLIIVAGIVLVVIFGTHEIPGYKLDSLIELITQPYFVFYSVTSFFIIIALFFLGKVNLFRMAKEAFFHSVDTDAQTHSHTSIVTKISISSLCGICGGNGNLLAKACIEALDQEGFVVIQRPEFLLLAFSTACLCFLQAVCLTMALGRYEAKFVVPMVNSCLVASGSAGGIILFKEYSGKNHFAMLFFSVGICAVILGIFVLMAGSSALNINEYILKDEERSGLIHPDFLQIKTSNIIPSTKTRFKPIGSESDSEGLEENI